MDKWQPIETAPKDGKRVLLYWPSYSYEITKGPIDDPVVDTGWFTTNDRIDESYAEYSIHSPDYFTNTTEWDCYGFAQEHNYPTHWMPLPDPPTP